MFKKSGQTQNLQHFSGHYCICYDLFTEIPLKTTKKRAGSKKKPSNKDNIRIHPRNLTWNLKMMVSKRNLLFHGLIFRFHVKLRGRKKCHAFLEKIWVLLSCQPSSSMPCWPSKNFVPRTTVKVVLDSVVVVEKLVVCEVLCVVVVLLTSDSRFAKQTLPVPNLGKNIWGFPKIVGFPSKSSILIGFSIINHPFWGTTIFGNTHMGIYDWSKY